MTFTEQEKKILDDALYTLLYNVNKEEKKIKELEKTNPNIEILKCYNYKSEEVRNLIRKIL